MNKLKLFFWFNKLLTKMGIALGVKKKRTTVTGKVNSILLENSLLQLGTRKRCFAANNAKFTKIKTRPKVETSKVLHPRKSNDFGKVKGGIEIMV